MDLKSLPNPPKWEPKVDAEINAKFETKNPDQGPAIGAPGPAIGVSEFRLRPGPCYPFRYILDLTRATRARGLSGHQSIHIRPTSSI